MIKSIFFSHFHTGKGPEVLFQVPDGSITSSPTASQSPLFDFDTLSDYIIPRQDLCDRLLTICANKHRILGYPICLEDPKYDRNQYLFNIAIVLEEDCDPSSYKSVVRKLARLFKALEEQSGFLWNEVTRSGVYSLIEQVMEDLNNYCECMIPINDSNTINIKLFPIYAPPPPVKAYHVPICTVRLELLMDVNWDLTMQKIIPFIDGINSVKRISELADADFNLTRKCIEHLLYYGCLIMVDIFQFNAIYAVTSELTSFASDPSMQEECLNYVYSSNPPPSQAQQPQQQQQQPQQQTHTITQLCELYACLCQGLTLKEWCLDNKALLRGVDIRRFISFGIIKGILYRVHKYPVSSDPSALDKKLPMAKYLDGNHHFDEICTELQIPQKEAKRRLAAGHGDIQIVHR